MHKQLPLILIALLFVAGCASQRYAWNGYDDSLYAYYKNPADKERYIERLQQIIIKGERVSKVPPGIYAEYGYMLYEAHNFSEAVIYFQKEKKLWPESTVFMDKMILNTQKLINKTTPQSSSS